MQSRRAFARHWLSVWLVPALLLVAASAGCADRSSGVPVCVGGATRPVASGDVVAAFARDGVILSARAHDGTCGNGRTVAVLENTAKDARTNGVVVCGLDRKSRSRRASTLTIDVQHGETMVEVANLSCFVKSEGSASARTAQVARVRRVVTRLAARVG